MKEERWNAKRRRERAISPKTGGPLSRHDSLVPAHYVDAYLLAKDGFSDAEIARKLNPPLTVAAFEKAYVDDKAFKSSVDRGKRECNPNSLFNGLTQDQKAALMAYIQCGNIRQSMDYIGGTYQTWWNWLDNENFVEAAKIAYKLHGDTLIEAAVKRARDGLKRYKFFKGQAIMVPCEKGHEEAVKFVDRKTGEVSYKRHYYEVYYSDTLLVTLLQNRVEGFKPNTQVNITQTNSTTFSLNDVLTAVENSRKKVVDADFVKNIAQTIIEQKKDEIDD
jgi:hypothetical protein